MKTFKTICHNNIHRDYTDEIVTVDPNSPFANMLWRDNRPRFRGELKLVFSKNGFDFQVGDLVVGKEYTLKIEGPVASIQVGESCMVGTADDADEFVSHMLFVDDRPDGLNYRDFFYSEDEMRDNKINSILK